MRAGALVRDAWRQAFLVSLKMASISSILASSSSALAASSVPLVPEAPAELGRLVDEGVQLRVLLEVRRLEVVGPQHPEVVLDELGALLLDEHRARAEVGVVVVGHLGDDRLDRLGLDAGLGGVVDTAGQVAVGADVGDAEEGGEAHERPFRWAGCRPPPNLQRA